MSRISVNRDNKRNKKSPAHSAGISGRPRSVRCTTSFFKRTEEAMQPHRLVLRSRADSASKKCTRPKDCITDYHCRRIDRPVFPEGTFQKGCISRTDVMEEYKHIGINASIRVFFPKWVRGEYTQANACAGCFRKLNLGCFFH